MEAEHPLHRGEHGWMGERPPACFATAVSVRLSLTLHSAQLPPLLSCSSDVIGTRRLFAVKFRMIRVFSCCLSHLTIGS